MPAPNSLDDPSQAAPQLNPEPQRLLPFAELLHQGLMRGHRKLRELCTATLVELNDKGLAYLDHLRNHEECTPAQSRRFDAVAKAIRESPYEEDNDRRRRTQNATVCEGLCSARGEIREVAMDCLPDMRPSPASVLRLAIADNKGQPIRQRRLIDAAYRLDTPLSALDNALLVGDGHPIPAQLLREMRRRLRKA